jgi:hypothetical protein
VNVPSDAVYLDDWFVAFALKVVTIEIRAETIEEVGKLPVGTPFVCSVAKRGTFCARISSGSLGSRGCFVSIVAPRVILVFNVKDPNYFNVVMNQGSLPRKLIEPRENRCK